MRRFVKTDWKFNSTRYPEKLFRISPRSDESLRKDFSPASSDLPFLQNPSFNLGGIAEVDAAGEADVISTGRIESVRHPVVTKVALLDLPGLLVKGYGAIGTGLYTATATGDTPL